MPRARPVCSSVAEKTGRGLAIGGVGGAENMDATRVSLVISSEVRLIDLVHLASEGLAKAAGFDEDESLNVGLAVREAAINAVVHGNQEDPGRSVTIDMTLDEDALRARIQDQGGGFDADDNADPTSPEALMATSGRGLLMIRAFVDEVEQRTNDEGFEVVLVKKLQSTESTDG